VISDRITELRDWINAVMVMADLTAEVSERVVDERDPFQEAVLVFLAEDHSIEDEETLASIGLSRAAQLGRSPDADESPTADYRGGPAPSPEAIRGVEAIIANAETVLSWPADFVQHVRDEFEKPDGWKDIASGILDHHTGNEDDRLLKGTSPMLKAEILGLLMRSDFEKRVRNALAGGAPMPSSNNFGALGGGAAQSSCCPPGSWPALKAPSDYVPTGSVSNLGDLPIYTSGSPGDAAILVWPEVFGWEGRLKNICDQLASEGYFVVMPDHMRGETMATGGQGFLKKWADYDSVTGRDITEKLLPYLKQNGVTKIGAIGFCWGAWVVHRASAAGVPLLCGACCHPSVRLENMADGPWDEMALAEKVRCPMLMAAAGNDPENVKEGGAVSDILMRRFPTSVIRSFPAQQHGWVSRGDVTDDAVASGVRDALQLCQDFFVAHVGPGQKAAGGMGGGGYAAGMGGGGYLGSPAVTVTPGMRVTDWLQATGLQACMSVLADLGYDEGVDMLAESDNEEQRDMVNAVRRAVPLCALYQRRPLLLGVVLSASSYAVG
jgi:dienelactone hydrolase